jgi:prepilin-type processing-associated H-X9-DG protein
LNRFYSKKWTDLPASSHSGAASLTFADGHAEVRKRQFASTRPPNRPDVASLPFALPSEERGDFDWLMQRTSLDND